ncbi:MAG: UDP-N-acetylglucosamine 2-epimerase (non-hydrolyzing) [Ruminococcaceae bacterium]|nr:UDP-N-acetylglucosamine 2-epimerase (non-hydrolyzing) [Oscillospiraceae bacterium]
MKKPHIMCVFGTRPDAVKMCPLVLELKRRPELRTTVTLTAQHREMLDAVTALFGVKADYDLNIMKPAQTLQSITTDILAGMTKVLREDRPDLVLVHGDTSTCFVAALAAFYEKIPVGHVEAGLRSFDRYSPFPEEMNRSLVGRLAELHFAPTVQNRANLVAEGITEGIHVTGNTVIDAFAYTVREGYTFADEKLRAIDFDAPDRRFITLTAHRRENQGEGIAAICRAVRRIVDAHPDVTVIYPVHLSPAVRNTVFPLLEGHERIVLCDPVGLGDMHNLMAKSTLVLTDSGGLQEEAPSLGVPVLVLRTETERPEAVEAGTVKIIGVDEDVVVAETECLLNDAAAYEAMAHAVNPYGDGHASERIADAIIAWAEGR